MSTSVIYKIIISLLIIPGVSANILINEIMYNPAGSDTDREWIEIYNNGNCEDISNYKLFEANTNHNLNLIQGSSTLCNNEYAVIADDSTKFILEHNFTGNLFDSTFSLSNTNETISIKDNTNTTDTITYYNTQGADGNSKSLCRTITTFIECEITPGEENSFTQTTSEEIIYINEFFPDPEGDDNAPMPDGEFIELYNPNNYEINLLNYKLLDEYGHTLIITDINTLSGTIIQPNSYLTVYTNTFSGLLNNIGYESISLYNNKLIDKVTYAFTEEGLTWSKVNNIWQLRIPTPNEENKQDPPTYESYLEIENIYLGTDEKAKFGDNLRARLNIYKGNTSKNSVKLFIPELTKETRVNLYEKFTNYTITLSVQIEPNCNEKYQSKEYPLTLKGLNKETSEEILIEGITSSLCQKIKQNATKQITYEIVENPKQIEQETSAKIKIINNEPRKTEYKVWSYISKGRKIITGDSEDNKITIELPRESSTIIELKNNIEPDAESDTYTYKIKLLKEGRKTPVVIESSININNTLHSEKLIKPPKFTNKAIYTGNAVYASSSIKARNAGIFIFSALLIILIIILLLRK